MEGSAIPESRGRRLTYAAMAIAVVAIILSAVALALPMLQVTPAPAGPAPMTRRFVLSSDLLNGSNRWFPSSLTAFAGDSVVFNLTNRGVIAHGFSVEGLAVPNLPAVLDPSRSAEFTASNVSAGLYRYFCQLHPGHIGGQLHVLSR